MNREEIQQKLAKSLSEQLNELANANHCGAGTAIKAIGRTEVSARLASVERVACEVESIFVSDPRLGALDTQQLCAISDTLARSLSYLEERLIVLEVDPVGPQVQMRSEIPHIEADARSYFEVQAGKLRVTLQRFQKSPGSRRQQVPSALTRTVFTRVCADMVVAVRGCE